MSCPADPGGSVWEGKPCRRIEDCLFTTECCVGFIPDTAAATSIWNIVSIVSLLAGNSAASGG